MLFSRSLPIIWALVVFWLAAAWGAPALAENIDPTNDGSQYAYAENVGWMNAEPNGNGGNGIQVGDTELSGWMWGENIGWVSLSCLNIATCSITEYRVHNDGCGTLTGYAWAENAGWINFSPSTSSVTIDPATGEFAGRAWGENIGWITFASDGPHPYVVETSWRVPALIDSTTLTVSAPNGGAVASWNALAGATAYDIAWGDLGTLRGSGGDFSSATAGCVDNEPSTSVTVPGSPSIGGGIYFVVRGEACGQHGTYESGEASQIGLRDAEIAASGNDCP